MTKTKPFISRELQREPTMTRTAREKFARAIVRLFKEYRDEITDTLYAHTAKVFPEARELADDVYVNIGQFTTSMQRATESMITRPAAVVIDTNIPASYKRGILRTDQIVPGISPPVNIVADWRAMDALKSRNYAALKLITDEMNGQIVREISNGMAEGKGITSIAKDIVERVDNIGIQRATAFARTETVFAFNQGAASRYSQYGYKKLRWYAALDERTCSICGALHNKVFSVDNLPANPAHVNCRCTWLPVEEGEEEVIPVPEAARRKVKTPKQIKKDLNNISKEYDKTIVKKKKQLKDAKRRQVGYQEDYSNKLNEICDLKFGDERYEKLHTDLEAARKRVVDIGKRIDQLDGEIFITKQTRDGAMRRALEINPKSELKTQIVVDVGDYQKIMDDFRDDADGASKFVGRVTNPKILKNAGTIDIHPSNRMRSSTEAATGNLLMSPIANRRDFVHELGHVIELRNGNIYEQAVLYRETRKTNEELLEYNTVLRRQDNEEAGRYRSDEMGYETNLPDPYMGKAYPDDWHSSEMISMSYEQLYADPYDMMKKDPDLFEWFMRLIQE